GISPAASSVRTSDGKSQRSESALTPVAARDHLAVETRRPGVPPGTVQGTTSPGVFAAFSQVTSSESHGCSTVQSWNSRSGTEVRRVSGSVATTQLFSYSKSVT